MLIGEFTKIGINDILISYSSLFTTESHIHVRLRAIKCPWYLTDPIYFNEPGSKSSNAEEARAAWWVEKNES